MFRKTRFLVRLGIVGLCLMAFNAKASEFRDTDWNLSLQANCPLPENSVIWDRISSDTKLKFALDRGDIGGCKSDGKRRNGAKYWERAELRQAGSLPRGQSHKVRFQAKFVEGFKGQDETFFQIHSWSKECTSAPLMMLQFDKGVLQAKILQRQSERHKAGISRNNKGALVPMFKKRKDKKGLKLNQLSGKYHVFEVSLDMTEKRPTVSLSMNGRTLIKPTKFYLRKCAEPHVKIGIYRPGKKKKTATSVLLIDDLTIKSGG